MQLKITQLFIFIFLTAPILLQSQVISSKVIDAKTNEALPFVNVFLASKKGVITNAEGKFTFQLPKNTKPADSLFISFIGYEQLGKPLQEFTEDVILLNPKAIELNTVIVTNKNLSAEEVIEKVEENIQTNYNFNFTKKKIFFRESNHQNFVKTDYEFKKSTIDELNEPFLDSVLNTLPKKYDYYSEILCDLYGDYSKENQKIHMIKASELYDKTNEIGMTALEDKFNDIIKKNVKPNSYFKIKSGLFGQKVDMEDFVGEEEKDSTQVAAAKEEIEKQKKREAERKKNFAKWRKNTLAAVLESLFFNEDSNRNFIRKSNRYEFTHVDFTYLGEAAVYVIDFVPKRKEEYKGRIYVNADDFAIVRLDYVNVKPLKSFSLFGISFKQYESTGTLFFEKNELNKYDLKYLEKTNASRFGIRRPLKIIEKNKHVKGRRKQNELYVKLDMATTAANKYEIVVFDVDASDKSRFEAFKEDNKISAVYLPAYDPEFWKGYNIIEPNQAIKEFKAAE
ncbi:carboxypeptidase-like regulatory domain-containing protein [Spongiivirga citrea]|uniref:Carboxypeptidase-like regulatory domain-containing protein n=1 Tax=Spongiivirga citrea TaxID=1481457 RepID=A0A6M0CJ69_9FLAO|nr:carboxypeptidase-like regulatory domain-containing protein [Spongiivirga citrea]NER17965.1 carboxypeptidase-like regulatory domain-containing protein [Spongiivirga citrea]